MEKPTANWLKQYEQSQEKLKPTSDLNSYFTKSEICGRKMHILDMGFLTFPTGKILVADPLVYLDRDSKPYFLTTPMGAFPLKAAVVELEADHYRYAAVMVKFNDNLALDFISALTGDENFDDLKEDYFFGFNVDAGLATIVDIKTRDAYSDFIDAWSKDNPDGSPYDDLFAEEFSKSYEKNPEFQRKDGDWINFPIPNTDLSVPMFQTGFGDGSYPVYFGYDIDGNICQLVIHFIDVESE
jgi:hypothetical protein